MSESYEDNIATAEMKVPATSKQARNVDSERNPRHPPPTNNLPKLFKFFNFIENFPPQGETLKGENLPSIIELKALGVSNRPGRPQRSEDVLDECRGNAP